MLYRFNGSDGHRPYGGDVVLDGSGHLYDTTRDGGVNVDTTWGDGYGIVYKLTPAVTAHRHQPPPSQLVPVLLVPDCVQVSAPRLSFA